MDDIIYGPFEPADQVCARHLILAGLGEHFGYIDETLNPDIDDITRNYVACGNYFIVANCDNTLIGTAALKMIGLTDGQIVRVSVSSAYRRRGIAAALVEHLIAEAMRRGLSKLLVETNKDWQPAIELYRRRGFTEYDRDEGHVYLSLVLAPGP